MKWSFPIIANICIVFLFLFASCKEEMIPMSVKNETNDTIFVSMFVGERGWYPGNTYAFMEVPPDSIYTDEIEEYWWDDDGLFQAFIVKQNVADSITLPMVIVKRLWSKVYTYTYSEMEKMNFLVRVKPEDLEQ